MGGPRTADVVAWIKTLDDELAELDSQLEPLIARQSAFKGKNGFVREHGTAGTEELGRPPHRMTKLQYPVVSRLVLQGPDRNTELSQAFEAVRSRSG